MRSYWRPGQVMSSPTYIGIGRPGLGHTYLIELVTLQDFCHPIWCFLSWQLDGVEDPLRYVPVYFALGFPSGMACDCLPTPPHGYYLLNLIALSLH